MKWVLAALLIATASASVADAKPLTIRMGESWAFRLANGDPVKARRIESSAAPAKGEIKVTVRAFLGTMLTAVNATGQGYRFSAELLSKGKASSARTCTLPADTTPIMEQWQGKTAESVRISRFVPANGGTC